jgi:plasmid stabilization system protein ParE
MKVVYTPRAEADLAHHFNFGTERFGRTVAERTLGRLKSYLDPFRVTYPHTATYLPQVDAFEAWVPKTPFVVFFRVERDGDVLRVLAIFHAAQDRSQFDPSAEA